MDNGGVVVNVIEAFGAVPKEDPVGILEPDISIGPFKVPSTSYISQVCLF